VFLFKSFNELFQVEPAVGNNAEDFDMFPDTTIGRIKEGKDVVPGCHITGAVPQMNDVSTLVQKGQKWMVAWSAVFGRVVAFLCSSVGLRLRKATPC
jgi:hypothetical protein